MFGGAPRNFFEPPKPYLALETSLLGGHSLKLFGLDHSFGDIQGYFGQKNDNKSQTKSESEILLLLKDLIDLILKPTANLK